MIKAVVDDYWALAKPGIIIGNSIAAISTFIFASKYEFSILSMLAVLFGTAFVVASGCVFNNIIDIDIDSIMTRTRNRPLIKQTISKQSAVIYATVLLVFGLITLAALPSYWPLFFSILGFTFYVGAYSMWGKRYTVHGTVIGSISGASPPAIGYVAVSHGIDLPLLCIFLLYCAWQMPHSYAIALFRSDDYQSTNIPILPLVKGTTAARQYTIYYVLMFLAFGLGLFLTKSAGYFYLFGFVAISLYWLYFALQKPASTTEAWSLWGRKLFGASIIVIMSFSFLIIVDTLIFYLYRL